MIVRIVLTGRYMSSDGQRYTGIQTPSVHHWTATAGTAWSMNHGYGP